MAARGRGRPKFTPTDQQREQIKALAAVGMPQPNMAARLGITEKTLRKNFRSELDNGLAEANAQVGATLFRLAVSGKNIAATIFWMKTQGGYKETDRRELTGPDGGRIQLDVKSLSDEQIARLLATEGVAGPAAEIPGQDPEIAAGSDPGPPGRTGTAPDSPADDGGTAAADP